jgi:riboflavin kinase / FMN adenylyltransferase
MKIYRSLAEIEPRAPSRALTIGNFDGVHLAHRHLFERVAEVAHAHGYIPSVLTFDPHPTRVVAPDRAPKLLSKPEQRFDRMADAGIEQIFLLPFNRNFAELTPEEFVEHVLVDTMHAKAVLVGANFRFGNRQRGDTTMLTKMGARFGFTTEVVSGMRVRGRMVSSTEVRRLVLDGNVSMACRLLGRPYALEGEVVSGFGIGSRQTVPTLNLKTDAEVLPANGVYLTRTEDLDGDRSWHSITNVGHRPTFGGTTLTIETHLLEALEGQRPAQIRLRFLRRVREERKFDSPELLKQQILKDVGRAEAYFRRVARLRALQRPV